MSKGLRSIPKKDRSQVVSRRLNSNVKGLGYWGARDYVELEKSGKLNKS